MTGEPFLALRERQVLPGSLRPRKAVPRAGSAFRHACQGFVPTRSPRASRKLHETPPQEKTGRQSSSTILLTIQVTIVSSVRRAHIRARQVGVDANAGKAAVV